MAVRIHANRNDILLEIESENIIDTMYESCHVINNTTLLTSGINPKKQNDKNVTNPLLAGSDSSSAGNIPSSSTCNNNN